MKTNSYIDKTSNIIIASFVKQWHEPTGKYACPNSNAQWIKRNSPQARNLWHYVAIEWFRGPTNAKDIP